MCLGANLAPKSARAKGPSSNGLYVSIGRAVISRPRIRCAQVELDSSTLATQRERERAARRNKVESSKAQNSYDARSSLFALFILFAADSINGSNRSRKRHGQGRVVVAVAVVVVVSKVRRRN